MKPLANWSREKHLSSPKFRKGDLVIVDEKGRPSKYEIVSVVQPSGRIKGIEEQLYEAKNVTTGGMRTIAQEEVLRRATPIDSSADLFEEMEPKKKQR